MRTFYNIQIKQRCLLGFEVLLYVSLYKTLVALVIVTIVQVIVTYSSSHSLPWLVCTYLYCDIELENYNISFLLFLGGGAWYVCSSGSALLYKYVRYSCLVLVILFYWFNTKSCGSGSYAHHSSRK